MRFILCALAFVLAVIVRPAFAVNAATLDKLAFGESDEKVVAVAALVADGDEQALAVLQALANGELQTSGKKVFILKDGAAIDPINGAKIDLPADHDDITVNNRLRREIESALAALK